MTATATSAPAIRVRGLRKSYGDRVVLDGIDLDVAQGSVFALLGPNGAGKTTTIHILSTLLAADAGDVSVGGHDVTRDPAAVRGLIGVTGQVSAVDKQFTGEENLRLMADLCHLGRDEGRRRVADLLERFELTDDAAKQAHAVLGRDEAPPRPGDDAHRPAADHLPRRADDRPRPAQPAGHVADRPRARGRRRHDPADDAVPRGGRPPRIADRAARPRPHRGRRARRAS